MMDECRAESSSVDEQPMIYDLIVIGGGIAGVTCAQSVSFLQPDTKILLISASPLIKAVVNYKQLTKVLEEFDVEEKPSSYLESNYPNVKVIHAVVTALDSVNHIVCVDTGSKYSYKKLCLCAGGQPKVIAENNQFVLGIRDTESVQSFQQKLTNARRVAVVGNGGIATELVYELENIQIIWAIKDESITATFIDAGAAQFFLATLNDEKSNLHKPVKREKYVISKDKCAEKSLVSGSALGPDWHTGYELKGRCKDQRSIHVEYKVEVKKILTKSEFKQNENLHDFLVIIDEIDHNVDWPVYLELTNGKVFGCDFVVSATGVRPNSAPFIMKMNNFSVSEDGGLMVDKNMRTNISDIYAAGDICTPTWEPAKHWIQMKLWTQARQMGIYTGKCIDADLRNAEMSLDFCFEIFTHVTQFFGYKVVLLGKFNAQNLGTDYHILLRMTEGKEYVKAVMQDGRMQGAVLIGETDLEETFENLILNQMDLSVYGEDLLHPDIDIEDYFD